MIIVSIIKYISLFMSIILIYYIPYNILMLSDIMLLICNVIQLLLYLYIILGIFIIENNIYIIYNTISTTYLLGILCLFLLNLQKELHDNYYYHLSKELMNNYYFDKINLYCNKQKIIL